MNACALNDSLVSKDVCRTCTESDGETSGQVQSAARNGHPSISQCSIVVNSGF